MKTSDWIVPGVITMFSCVVIYLSLQLDLSPPMIVGHSMQPRAFPIFLMVINLILIGLLTYQFYKNPPASIPLEPFHTWGTIILLIVFYGLTVAADFFPGNCGGDVSDVHPLGRKKDSRCTFHRVGDSVSDFCII
ncbi:MAG: hypothetical protein CM15mP28_2360 [Pseudomonadota bacterium]|nr:MAG: hypothetical protein CM15mP28_2360 [Pseudomonadota bacterium]